MRGLRNVLSDQGLSASDCEIAKSLLSDLKSALQVDEAEMTLDKIIPAVVSAIPEFAPDKKDVEDRSPYLISHDLIRFTFERDPNLDAELIKRVFQFWEHLFDKADREVEMLLRDIAWVLAEEPDLYRFKHFLGKRLRRFVRQSPAGAVLDG